MRAFCVTLLLTVPMLAVPGAQAQSQAPDGVHKDCSCGVTYSTRHDWHPHRPSTAAERTETSRLNREYLAAARATPLPVPEPGGAQQAYQEQLKNYRALTQSYERRMRDYNRLHGQADPPQAEERRWQDAARLDPWRGYNSHGGNGY
ncbi:MAG TPA: hypothetical protein VJS85_03145 [Rhizomicrobium sp.]|nr:hypothetical protein [Rhizomicrobium sp.]